jgi:hypothetical protein
MPPKPRRRKPSGKLLPPEQRAKKAAAILARAVPKGLGVDRAAIQGELYRLDEACARAKRVRSRGSKRSLRAIRTFLAAAKRANGDHGGLPEDFRLLLGLDALIYHLEAYAFTGAEAEFLREPAVGKDGKPVVSERGEPVYRMRVIAKPRRPAPDAFEKRLAARAALRLCHLHEVEASATKGGTLCELAAALIGDPSGIDKHARAALAAKASAPNRDEKRAGSARRAL